MVWPASRSNWPLCPGARLPKHDFLRTWLLKRESIDARWSRIIPQHVSLVCLTDHHLPLDESLSWIDTWQHSLRWPRLVSDWLPSCHISNAPSSRVHSQVDEENEEKDPYGANVSAKWPAIQLEPIWLGHGVDVYFLALTSKDVGLLLEANQSHETRIA